MVDERAAERMSGEGRSLQLERVQNVPEMLDERVYGVFVARDRLVGQPVPLEIDGDDPEPRFGNSGHVAPEYIDRPAPAMNEHDRGRLRVAPLHRSDFQTGA